MRTPLCSLAFDAIPAWGTAPRADFWLALEQPGPWGAKAFTESGLDPDLGARLDAACSAAGGKALLMREIGAHRDDVERPRRVVVAGGPATAPWVRAGVVDDPAVLLDWPLDDFAAGNGQALERWGLAESGPVALVCTNAKRDACCAVRGRPVALAAAALAPGSVFECSHLGGHRFAPTAVVLPTGQVLGHATADDVAAALDAAREDRVVIAGPKDRGLSRLTPEVQVAEAYARAEFGGTGLADLTADVEADEITVTHRDGRSLRLRVTRTDTGASLPESCGKDAKPVVVYGVSTA